MPQHYFIKQDDYSMTVFSQLISTYFIFTVFSQAYKEMWSVACISECPVKKVGSLKEEF